MERRKLLEPRALEFELTPEPADHDAIDASPGDQSLPE